MLKEVVIGGAAFGLGYLVNTVMRVPSMPPDVALNLERLRFHHVVRDEDMTNIAILSYGEEAPWRVWNVGYGWPEGVPNNIIVDLGFNTATGEISCSIAKLGHGAVEVYKDEALLVTFEEYTAPDTLFQGYVNTILVPAM